jgi:glutathione peroxidase-family protein
MCKSLAKIKFTSDGNSLYFYCFILFYEFLSRFFSSFFPSNNSILNAQKTLLYEYKIKDVFGKNEIDLSTDEFKNKVVLIVNVASKCGLTDSNYNQLKTLNDKYHDKGLRILLFPCNQFAKQEPGDSETVCRFIQAFSNQFIIAEKCNVNGKDTHPIYQWLKLACPGTLGNAIKWNFTKVTIY